MFALNVRRGGLPSGRKLNTAYPLRSELGGLDRTRLALDRDHPLKG